jgi:subtilisin family serine protease
MTDFSLKYGTTKLDLNQSRTLIGVRPNRSQDAQATDAIGRAFEGRTWTEAGQIGGFRIVAVENGRFDVDAALDRIRRDGSVATGTHVFETPAGANTFVPTGDLFIEFRPDLPQKQREALLDRFSLTIKEARGSDGVVVAVTPQSPNPIKVAAGLQNEAGVSIAEPDLASRQLARSMALLSDNLLADQWHLRNIGFHRNSNLGFVAGADARVVEAWSHAATRGRGDVVVAVIDDGFDLSHPDLAPTGKVIHPWDFTRRSNNPRPASGDWHGTACAGVAVAAQGGGGVIGAAPGCTLMPIRWGANLADSEIEAWFGYVTAKGAWVVSCSWGALNPFFPLSTRAHRAIEQCARLGRGGRGCVIVFAAGNDNRDVNNPAGGSIDGFAIHPDVIAVAASTSRDERSNYSNFGREISVCAPSSGAGGWGILTADVTGINAQTGEPLGYDEGDYTYTFGGTSSACPLTAGVAALMLSVAPTLTAKEVKRILQRTARKIGPAGGYDASGHSRQFGYGCINAAEAIRVALESAQPLVSLTAVAAHQNGKSRKGVRRPRTMRRGSKGRMKADRAERRSARM